MEEEEKEEDNPLSTIKDDAKKESNEESDGDGDEVDEDEEDGENKSLSSTTVADGGNIKGRGEENEGEKDVMANKKR